MVKDKLLTNSYAKIRKNNLSTMSNGLISAQEDRHWDYCCGIHGAARARKGVKKATSAYRRRNDKEVIKQSMEEL